MRGTACCTRHTRLGLTAGSGGPAVLCSSTRCPGKRTGPAPGSGTCTTEVSRVSLKADLDGTTLTYDCRMQLAPSSIRHGLLRVNQSHNFPKTVAYNSKKVGDFESKLHGTVVSQSCVV